MKKKNAFVAISPDRLNSIYHQPFILKPNCLYMYICMIEIYMTGLFFGLRTLGTIVILYSFCFCITPVITMSESFAGSSIDQQCKSIDWFLCNSDVLIEVYSSTLYMSTYFVDLFICFMLSMLLLIDIINFIVCCCCCCCLITFLFISLQLFWSFSLFFYCRLSVLCYLCCDCLLAPCSLFANIILQLFLFLFSL